MRRTESAILCTGSRTPMRGTALGGTKVTSLDFDQEPFWCIRGFLVRVLCAYGWVILSRVYAAD